jgi:RNA polymerase sigma factor (sigma-70 family)
MERATETGWSQGQIGALYMSRRAEFLGLARANLGDSHRAEEIVQDALVRVLLAETEFNNESHAVGYFKKVIQNLIIDEHRSQGRRPQLVLLDDLDHLDEFASESVADHFEALAAADDAAIIREALSLLSANERTALVMWELEGRSTTEVARVLGIKESSVRHTLTRARASLRQILSRRIIDSQTGATAMDLLSKSYRGTKNAIKKSGTVALSLLLLLAMIQFVSLDQFKLFSFTPTGNENVRIIGDPNNSEEESDAAQSDVLQGQKDPSPKFSTNEDSDTRLEAAKDSKRFASEGALASLEGIDLPTGFMVQDSSGKTYDLFVGQVTRTNSETGWMLTNIVSLRSDGPQIVVGQSVVTDSFGTSYIPEVSFGLDGRWKPAEVSLISSDLVRVASGGYLVDVVFKVERVLDPVIDLPAREVSNGLSAAPRELRVQLLLSPSKTEILAQKVYVSGISQGSKA